MSGIRRVSDLGTKGMQTIVDGSVQSVDLASNIALTGTPTAPTAAANTNTTQLATTAFVTTADNLKANIASPALTGTPTAPTAAAGTNTTQLATTAFVTASNAIYSGQPLKYYSSTSSLSQKIYAATNDTLFNLATYTTNSLATSVLLITFGVAYEMNTATDTILLACSLNGVDQFSFSDTNNSVNYNEFPFYTFRSINTYSPNTAISNFRIYVKSASGTVVCPRATGGPLNFSLTVQEYAV
jgi:hypothetical protein